MKPSPAPTFLASTAMLMLAGTSAGATVNWTNQGYAPGIDGFNPHETTISASNVQNLTLAWQSSTTDVNGVYAMVEDKGTLFVESNDQSNGGDVVAIDTSTGAELWKASLDMGVGVSTAGLSDASGRVFAQCSQGGQTAGLCAFSQKTGKLDWFLNLWNTQSESFGGSISRPTSASGVVYFASSFCPDVYNEGSCSYAVNASSGQIQWMTETPASGCCGDGGTVVPGPAVSPANNLVYVPCDYIFSGSLLHFFGVCTYSASDGTFAWNYDSATPDSTGPQGSMGMSVAGSTVYFQESNDQDSNGLDNLSALNAQTGAVLWTFTAPFSYHDNVQPTVAKRVVYWPDGNGALWALSEKTGATIWSTSNWGSFCSPVGGANGTESQPQEVNGVIFITTSCQNGGDRYVTNFALASSSGNVLWQDSEGFNTIPITASGAAPMIVNGELYTDCVNVCAYTLPGAAVRKP